MLGCGRAPSERAGNGTCSAAPPPWTWREGKEPVPVGWRGPAVSPARPRQQLQHVRGQFGRSGPGRAALTPAGPGRARALQDATALKENHSRAIKSPLSGEWPPFSISVAERIQQTAPQSPGSCPRGGCARPAAPAASSAPAPLGAAPGRPRAPGTIPPALPGLGGGVLSPPNSQPRAPPAAASCPVRDFHRVTVLSVARKGTFLTRIPSDFCLHLWQSPQKQMVCVFYKVAE